jgi:cytochrome c peroxidase
MKRRRSLLRLAVLVIVVAACKKSFDKTALQLSALPPTPRGLGESVDPPDNPTTLAKANLGRALFYDPKLSTKDFMSCADCHRDDHAWAGNESRSVNAMGGRTRRKAPTVTNAGYASIYTWDGRAQTLENTIAIGWGQLGMTDQEVIAKKLDEDPNYRVLFTEAFGAPATGLRIRQALAAYLRILKSGDSPYDRGELSDAAKRGSENFKSFGCATCHSGPMFSDYQFHNIGVGSGKTEDRDEGRFEVSKIESDRGRFRTPSLRDVARTGPWFHDGSAATLDQAIAVMATGGIPNGNLDPTLVKRTPSPGELADLKAFLEALNGQWTVAAPKVLLGGRPRS